MPSASDRAGRETRAGIVARMAGCFVCHAEAPWHGKNALALAARHHDATGHPTWCEQVMVVRYGAADALSKT